MTDSSWWQFLNNASVAAFLGAFSALLLIVLNDWRRRHRSKTQLRYLVSDNIDHARAKLTSVERNLAMLSDNQFVAVQIMPFPVLALKNKQIEVIDLLDSNENRGLDALLYWMEAIDGLLAEYRATANELRRAVESEADNAIRLRLAARMKTDLEDAQRNLGILIRLCESFVSGKYYEILEFQHPLVQSAKD
jgi:hypothetical protein